MSSAQATLEIEVMTPHGQSISDASVRVVGGEREIVAAAGREGVYSATLPEIGSYSLVVERPGKEGGFAHRPLRATLVYLRRSGEATLVAGPPQPAGVGSRVWSIRREQDSLFRVAIILDYRWFTPIGAPPTLGNRVALFLDGEEAWRAIAEAIAQARSTVHLTTWRYEATMELLRPIPLTDPAARERLTVQSLLEARAADGVTVRLLCWDVPFLRMTKRLRHPAAAAGDRFEIQEESNPTRQPLRNVKRQLTRIHVARFRVGSHHQKTVVLDGRIGFCGGMNLQERDWDSRDHRVFDPRRCRFSRSASVRTKVARGLRLPDYPPRQDYMARLEGPSLAHLQENFRERWNRPLTPAAERSGRLSRVDVPVPQPPAGSSQVQVVRTMPAPHAEQGILDVYRRAVASARRLIYIEDQFFHATYISDAIADAMRANPELEVVVVTNESLANNFCYGGWNRACFDRIRLARPDFELYSLKASQVDGRARRVQMQVFIHAKLLIVDDTFLLVGSCNVNDRGFDYEGELSLAVVDPDFVARFRADLWREHLGGDPRVRGELAADVAVWKEHAEQNRGYKPGSDRGPPAGGLVFPFTPRRLGRSFFDREIF